MLDSATVKLLSLCVGVGGVGTLVYVWGGWGLVNLIIYGRGWKCVDFSDIIAHAHDRVHIVNKILI